MATVVNMHDAKSSLSRLVKRAASGEEILIAKNGKPVTVQMDGYFGSRDLTG
jgi:prevent-host-death family protein